MMALSLALTWLENLVLVSIPGLPPGVRLGLSNVITMYCVKYISAKHAALIGAVKVIFVFATRGFTAGMLSFLGTLCSIVILIMFRDLDSVMVLSILSSIAHNLGQIIGCMLVLTSWRAVYYLPVLLLSGIAVGAVTGFIMKLVLGRIHAAREKL